MNTVSIFLISWLLAQISSLLMLQIGTRLAAHPWLIGIGQMAHHRKMSALDRVWPLTRLRPAVAREDATTCVVILSALIILKSLASFLLGAVVLFWLPLACLIVPTIITVHDPDDPGLMRWVLKVAWLQLTSHVLAAALGFAIVVRARVANVSMQDVLNDNLLLIVIILSASVVFAIAAGRTEAAGIVQRGI